ncbi:MAG: HAMP domain-containing histidine kinase [Oscillospiraceae bacterium]|nr:HAMP domain-containing histidine kinase [Oscillospiraceae bacterium]MBP0987823.1 HAMP domain-containing histidine kinase [Oscillospiraceae bacterium]MBQ5337756.1 HAMP domain-containing histidine kinase [Oscillospiraceae bacterium]MBR5363192.1 HAMP domain-containing histidine kinase [Oscillospiraceae bacterium]
MEQETSQSRSLRRRLLAALVSCLIAVLGICTMIFNLIYQQAAVNVNLYSGALAGQTVSAVSDAYYQQFLSAQQQYLHDFGREMSLLYQGTGAEALRESLRDQALQYFSGSDVFFLYDREALCSYELNSDVSAEQMMQDAAAVFDLKASESPEFFGSQTNFSGWLDACMEQPCGAYAKEGAGYVITWDNLCNYSGENLCFGLLMQNVSSWAEPVRAGAAEQTEALLNSMDSLFRKYMYMMMISVICVFAVFLIISAILSKKIADPVVSEHDMLVQVNEMKTTFLSDASHELKTPLAAMSGYAQDAELDLMNGGEKSTVQNKLRRISSEANRMALMVTQILDATRIEEGRMVLEKAPCDLDSLVRKTVETYFAVLNKNNNRLILRIPIDLPQVDADSTRLQRVFVNLISNALKHTKDGTVLIKAEAGEKTVTVTVKDTGSGISPEDLPHIWERYYKGKHSETGTGLGLFIVRFIVESHGGTINVESEQGKGTAFTFTLPLAANQLDDSGGNQIEQMLRK